MSSKSKLIELDQLKPHLRDGMSIMFGGFLVVGTPLTLVKYILDSGIKDLTIIGNDTSWPDRGIGVLVAERRVKRVITSHIGTNPETGRQMIAGETEVLLVPQSTLAERIRCAGAGLGGVLTPTGLGTVVEEGKQKIKVNGKEYLLEEPLRADLAILRGRKADTFGNIVYERAQRNFNMMMAMAADYVVAEVDEIVPKGQIDPDHVMTPGIFVDALVQAPQEN